MLPPKKRAPVKQDGPSVKDRKLNHVAAEKKRRDAIRRGFDQITAVVPDLDYAQSRSEAVVLEKSKKLNRQLRDEKSTNPAISLMKELVKENEELRRIGAQYYLAMPSSLS